MAKTGKGKRLCALLLSMAMLCTAFPSGVRQASAQTAVKELKRAGDIITKTTTVTVEDTLDERGPEWFGETGGVTFSKGKVNLEADGKEVSVKRNIGNGDFTAEIHWKNLAANTSGLNSVFMLRVRASNDNENDLIDIKRFSNGKLDLVVKSNNKAVVSDVNTTNNFTATEGWFRISYNKASKKVKAEYKAAGDADYKLMTQGETVIENFDKEHILQVITNDWASGTMSVDIEQVNSTFVKEAKYKYSENEDFTNPALPDTWYDRQGVQYNGDGKLILEDIGGGDGTATVKKNIGDQDFSVETQWSDFNSAANGGAILRISKDKSSSDFAQLARNGDGKLCFTVVENGKTSITKYIDYKDTAGWFRLDFKHETKEVDAYYRATENETYKAMPGSGFVADGLIGKHVVELITDDWSGKTDSKTSAAFDKIDIAYNEKLDLMLDSEQFKVEIDENTGAVFQLSNPGDKYGTNYVMNPDIHKAYDIDDSRWVGDLVFNVKKESDSGYHAANTSLSDDVREITKEDGKIMVSYDGQSDNQYGIKDFALQETYGLNETGDQLEWTIHIKNTSSEKLEIADLGLPLLMNSWWNRTQDGIYEQNVARHSYVAKDGSYIYWQRPNGDESFLVMTPKDGTSLEFKDKANSGLFGESDPSWEGLVEYYIHSKEVVNRSSGNYLPSTSLCMEADEEKTYGFTFQWASDYADLHRVLYDAGVVDAVSLPGMVIPKDMKATLALRCKETITEVTGDNDDIQIEKKEDRNGYSIYEIAFSTPGPNFITVHYGDGKESVLQYYSTETIEKLIESNTEFLVKNQQSKDRKRGYNGAYLQWSMKDTKRVSWHDYKGNDGTPWGGWKEWMAGGSDDLGLAPAVYLSEKNISAPKQEQIDSLEYYLEHFIWGYMQNHDDYQVYHWYAGSDEKADTQSWRSYNYVHVANTYYNMYRIAKSYPHMMNYLTADEYLLRCYNTLKAYFTFPMFDGDEGTKFTTGQGAYVFGNMGEMTLPGIIDALKAEGHEEEQKWLFRRVREKENILADKDYPFASEMSIDTTGFESCYTLGKMFDNIPLVEKTTKASLACRGVQPIWYFCGSDNRHMGESWWNLGYETQLGAWQQQDYLQTYREASDSDFDDIMRGTYSAYLAGWANINVGQISSDERNYGAAAWQYQSEKSKNGWSKYGWIANLDGWWAWSGEASLGFWGGVKAASVNIVDDDIVGIYGYGCDLDYTDGIYTIVPKDGIRTRFTMYNKGKFGIELSKARYQKAVIEDDLKTIRLTLEKVTDGACSPEITLNKLPAGQYELLEGDTVIKTFTSNGGTSVITLEGSAAEEREILIRARDKDITDITNEEKNSMNAAILNPDEMENVLTDAEKESLNAAEIKVKVELRCNDITENVSENEKELTKQLLEKEFANQYTEGAYLDLSIYKIIEDKDGMQEEIKTENSNGMLTIRFIVPERLQNQDKSVERTYMVIRLHDGVAQALELETDGNILTFKTDRFSTYALVYCDKKVGGSSSPAPSVKPSSGPSGPFLPSGPSIVLPVASPTPSVLPTSKPSTSPDKPNISAEPTASAMPQISAEPQVTPQPITNNTVQKNKAYTVSGRRYKVTSVTSQKKTVTLLRVSKNKTVKKLSIGATVKIRGQKFKITKIDTKAFTDCKKLESVVIGSNVITIGPKCFAGCTNLKKVIFKTKVLKKVGKDAFNKIHRKAVIKVPKARLKKYKKLLQKQVRPSTVRITK